ncbi:peroxide stress protein YaaA [Aequorivita marina]|uniref:peroxide stress protein YaaA n=1 Tax=Aequorivita marina TaxID=3073654 RepID=UPI002874367D|nr:peroxide stress protein YaaA [Aequorivita sp. S2608]MDS1296870.1 peroxide stress protein YaaA [Aequorivita sp. S2608]
MKIVVSPAKTLDYESELPTTRATQPKFLEEAELINNKLERKSKKAISELMGISDKLTQLNYQRYKDFNTPFTKENARPAVYAFAGDVYTGLDAYSIPSEKIDVLQDSLRILSGMYGMLRPLDLMQPYRLEMGTKLAVDRKKDLYDFWKNNLTETLNKELDDDELFLNLASVEYFNAIDEKKLKVPVIAPVFKDFKNGKLKIISFYAKKARGSMARFAIDNNIKNLDEVKAFDYDGYAYSEEYTEKEHEPVFIR